MLVCLGQAPFFLRWHGGRLPVEQAPVGARPTVVVRRSGDGLGLLLADPPKGDLTRVRAGARKTLEESLRDPLYTQVATTLPQSLP
jgi:hypothetical protein